MPHHVKGCVLRHQEYAGEPLGLVLDGLVPQPGPAVIKCWGRGVHEERVLALARRGDAWRMYRMGYDHALHEGRMRLRIEYWVRHASGNGHRVMRDTLPRELGIDEFLQHVRETFD